MPAALNQRIARLANVGLRVRFYAPRGQENPLDKKAISGPLEDARIPKHLFRGRNIFSATKYHLPSVNAAGLSNVRFLLAPPSRRLPRLPDPEALHTKAGGMLTTVQVIVTPTADTPGALLVVTFGNGDRYLFGKVAEGTQRAFNQRKQNMPRISNIFLTGPIDWHTAGGLLGMILTVADTQKAIKAAGDELNRKRAEQGSSKVKETEIRPLRIYGGRNLTHTIASARNFIFRTGMPIMPYEISEGLARQTNEPDFQDENLAVWNVPLLAPSAASIPQSDLDRRIREGVVSAMFGSNWRLDALREVLLHDVKLPAKIFHRDENGKLQPYNGPVPGRDSDCPNIPVLVRDPWPAASADKLPGTVPSRDSMCYIAKTNPRRGKFKPQVPRAHGIKPEDFKRLIAGESILGSDGVLVTPEMVVEQSIPGCGFIIVEIHSEELIDSFLGRPEWSMPEIMERIEAVYWILGDDIKDDPRLISWMKGYPKARHYLLAQGASPNRIALESPAAQVIQMRQIDPDRFKIPIHSNVTPPLPSDLAFIVEVPQLGTTLQLVPEVKAQPAGLVPVMNTRAPIDNLTEEREIMALVAAAKHRISDPSFIAQVEAAERGKPTDDVEVIPIGTGSAIPSKYRNVSANLIRTPHDGNYLLDCGENTLGQLRRLYGFEATDRVLADLRAIFISHSHADHHLGTASVLARRAELIKANPSLNPVALVCCGGIATWYRDYSTVQDLGGTRHVKIIQYSELHREEPTKRVHEAEVGSVVLPEIEVVPVDHCRDAMAVVLTWSSGLKIAYSGDCRPSSEFARVGKGAHLLIHEATFDSELQGEAIAKKHTTVAEALAVGREMQADKILLTHFSQRYPKLPIIEETEQTVLCAFDLMSVKLKEFKYAEAFLPALRLLLSKGDKGDEDEVMEEAGEPEPAKKKCKKEKREKKKQGE